MIKPGIGNLPLVILGIMLSTLHQSSLGSLFLIAHWRKEQADLSGDGEANSVDLLLFTTYWHTSQTESRTEKSE